jgi:4-amino-4-deoxy-L-arabinose transferase-like glycosyltransferase
MKTKHKTIVILTLILVLQITLRIPFLQEPLERDEGVYAYVAQRMLAGEVPYRDVFDHKPPAVYFIYAGIFKIFGESLSAIRISALFFSLITTLSVFAVGALLWGGGAGLLSAFLYGLFSGGAYIHGSSANTESFMVLPVVLGLLFFMIGSRQRGTGKRGWFLGAGLFSGTALRLKQVEYY